MLERRVKQELRTKFGLAAVIGAGLAALYLTAGCEREIPAEFKEGEVVGYEIQGSLYDRLGNPLRGVRVRLFYDFEYVDGNPPPSKEYFVSDVSKVLVVRVIDRLNRTVRVLLEARVESGPITVEWDQRDAQGRPVASGVYIVQYVVDGDVKKSYTVTVNGAVTATTDSLGLFLIPGLNLPIGFYPVPLYGSDGRTFLGNFRIIPFVTLEFGLDPRRAVYVGLQKDRVTRVDYKL